MAAKIAEVFSAVVDLLNNLRIEARAEDNNFWLDAALLKLIRRIS